MKRVLIYAMSEGKGGVEEFVLNLSRYTVSTGKKYGYVILGSKTIYEDELRRIGADYYFIPKKRQLFDNIQAMYRLLRDLRDQYDTVYFNTSGLYYPIPYVFARKFNYTIVLHSHSSSGSRFKRILHWINRFWINRCASERLACSIPAGRWMFGANRDFHLIPNAIDINRFEFNVLSRENCREAYGLQDSFVIGNVGRLHHVKNQTFLIDILRNLLDKGMKAKLLLVGDGEMRDVIVQKAQEQGVLEQVVIAGETNSPEYFYSAMDCFVMPSLVEGFPITLIEAQANGLPCVVADTITEETNVTGHVSFVGLNDKCGVWVDEILRNQRRYSGAEDLRQKSFDVYQLEEIVSRLLNNN